MAVIGIDSNNLKENNHEHTQSQTYRNANDNSNYRLFRSALSCTYTSDQMNKPKPKYKIALDFANECRECVEQIAIDPEVISEIAKAYQDNYKIPGLYEYLMENVRYCDEHEQIEEK